MKRLRSLLAGILHEPTMQELQAPQAGARLVEADPRVGLLLNHVREPILYVDADEICRDHNTALAQALGLPVGQIEGRPLREVLGEASYSCIKPAIDAALRGEATRLRQLQRDQDGRILAYDARYVPHLDGGNRTLGFYALLSPWRGQRSADTATSCVATGRGLRMDEEPRAPAPDILTGWDDPRERFLEALERDRFDLLKQEIVPVAGDGAGPRYYEVLLRLQDEDHNMMSPGAFFPVAMRYRLMGTLDRWVVRHVLGWYRRRCFAAPASAYARFCINLSNQTIYDESFERFVQAQLAAHGVPPERLCFEIAEADLLAHREQVLRCAHALQGLGCHIAIDGFGSAASSFDVLARLPLDFLKIDGGIISRIEQDANCLAKAKALIKLGHASGARVVAERVEKAHAVNLLRRLGVDYAQGFGLAMPEPLDECLVEPIWSPRDEQAA